MLRHLRLLVALLMFIPFLMGVSPLQQVAGGFTWQWWYWLCIVGLLVVALLWFIAFLAGRQSPPPTVQSEKYAPTLSHTPPPAPTPPAHEAVPAEPEPEPAPEPEPEPAAPDELPAAPAPSVDALAEPAPMAEPVPFTVEPAAAEPELADDLTRIEGVGPKINELLQGAGIHTFAHLAAASPDHLKEILEAAGPQFRLADPGSWPEQARLAAAEDWDGLQTLQDDLKGGREVS